MYSDITCGSIFIITGYSLLPQYSYLLLPTLLLESDDTLGIDMTLTNSSEHKFRDLRYSRLGQSDSTSASTMKDKSRPV